MTTPFDRMLDLCEQYPDAINYSKFDDIPSDLKCEGFVTAWIVSGAGSLEQVPFEERTMMMMQIAVSHDNSAFSIIKPDDVTDYPALILDAISNDPSAASDIPPEFLTEELIVKMANRRLESTVHLGLNGSNRSLLTDTLISSLVSRNVSSAITVMRNFLYKDYDRVKDVDLVKAIQVQVNDLAQLKAIGKTHLLIDMLLSGYWPNNLNAAIKMEKGALIDIASAPQTPHEALARLSHIQAQGVRFLHLQSLRRFPIEDVISTTQDIPKVVNLLLEVYSENELKPHLRLSNALRGRLLETELGL